MDLAVPTCIDAYGITYSRPNQSTSGLINYLNVVHIYERMKIRSEEFVDMQVADANTVTVTKLVHRTPPQFVSKQNPPHSRHALAVI